MNRRGLADARRLQRFWAAGAFALLIAVTVTGLDDPAPWRVVAGFAGLAALWLVLRNPRPAGAVSERAGRLNAAGRTALLSGLAIFVSAFAVSQLSAKSARTEMCIGQAVAVGPWRLAPGGIVPVAGQGFTALQANVAAQFRDRPPLLMTPQLRTGFGPAQQTAEPARVRLWNGDLTLQFTGYSVVPGDCMTLLASWRPFAGLAQLGGWLAAFGAAAMAMVALGAILWRSQARARIAMRREDRPLPGSVPPGAGRPPIGLPGAAMVTCMILGLTGYLALGKADWPWRTAGSVHASFQGGPALLAARQSLRETKTTPGRWTIIADAMARHGQFGDAAEVLRGAVEADPDNADAWLAMGDALFAHAGGTTLNDAAAYAYARADDAFQRQGTIPMAVATAMERSGRAGLARAWRLRQTGERHAP